MKSFLKTFLILCSLLQAMPALAEVNADLTKAGQAYFQNRLDEAESIYARLAEEYPQSADLLYNLGNIAFKRGQIGRAIWYYERALKLKPRDADLRANLKFALGRRAESFEVGAWWEKPLESLTAFADFVTRAEVLALLTLALTFFWLLLWLHLWFKRPVLKGSLAAFAILALFLGLALWTKTTLHREGSFGVVLPSVVEVRPSFLEPTTTVLKLHEGSQVRVLGQQKTGEKEEWYQIALPQGRKGWVESSQLGVY